LPSLSLHDALPISGWRLTWRRETPRVGGSRRACAVSSSYDRTGLALMFATIVVWAGSWVAMKWVVPYIGPFDFVAVRYLSGSAVLFALLAMLRRPLSMPSWGLTLCTGLTQTAAFQFCVQTALVTGAVGTVSLLAYTMPFWVVVFAWALLGDKPGP